MALFEHLSYFKITNKGRIYMTIALTWLSDSSYFYYTDLVEHEMAC